MTDSEKFQSELKELLKKSKRAKTERFELLRKNTKGLHIDNSAVKSFDKAVKVLAKLSSKEKFKSSI